MNELFNRLPLEIYYQIVLLLLTPKTKATWCYCCGERCNHRCKGGRCANCCHLHCLNQGHYYLDIYSGPPLTMDEFTRAILHLPKHRS